MSEALAQSATQIDVTVTIAANTYTSLVFGVADPAFTVYSAGAPDLLSGTGTFNFNLTPGQFTGSGSISRIAITRRPGTGVVTFSAFMVSYFG